ncbi:MAG TPA: 4a-hydroxytetrahydrobiopterin dehydratase [Acidimicrobiales bacterium]|nr:4a-hydroxytetrahydrobiopterin dehydratase [Acidimicrobiales bacterium]
MTVLSEDEVRAAVGDIEGWHATGDEITKDFTFADFPGAVAFVVRIAFEAEAANHHPDLDVRYNKVQVTLSTHSEGGVTEKDVELARAIQGLAQ